MSEPTLALEFIDPRGEPLRIEWDGDALASLDPGDPSRGPAWRLAGELDWDEVEMLRIVSGRLADDRLVAIAALRPAGARGHGDEVIAGALGGVEGFDRVDQTLLSTEYGADGSPRRIGLELYREDGGLPVRIAADVTTTASSEEGGVLRVSAALDLRSAGDAGGGVLDLLSRA